MYDIALTVAACLRSNTRVDVAWVVDTDGLGTPDDRDAIALTAGGGKVGSLLGGIFDAKIESANAPTEPTLLELELDEATAALAGVQAGGTARIVFSPASALPATFWQAMVDREPAVLDIAGVTSTWAPPVRFMVAGTGPIAETLAAAGELVGWRTMLVSEPSKSGPFAALMGPLDKVVVLGHEIDRTGPILESALYGNAGYIGALGSPNMQEARATWLNDRGVYDLSRINGPAGIDIGAKAPGEVAISVVAEIIALSNR